MRRLALVASLLAAFANTVLSSDVEVYCHALESEISPERVSYPNSTIYDESISSYYSGQERDLSPICIFRPESTEEVSQFIKIVTSTRGGCIKKPQFAIRSGGHMIWPGSANIEAGITVDMRAMNSVALSEDKKTVSLGPGGVWTDIYPQLTPHNLTVMGGRVSGIGVGGLATGGGIHYTARRNGWACDNIFAYEVVLADGSVVTATASSHDDLWLALKGGSNNFGIVTRFDVPAFQQGPMWGGVVAFNYTPEVLDKQAEAFSHFMDEENFDEAAHMGLTTIFQGGFAVGTALYYTEPVEEPEVYREFLEIPEQLVRNVRIADAAELASESDGLLPPNTTRAIDIVYSFKNGPPEVYSELFRSFEEGANKISDVEGLQLVLLIQPHPVTNGTNSLGLEPGKKDEVVSVLTAAYTRREDDDRVQVGMQEIIDAHENHLKEQGLYIPFQYLNYADITQDPIGSYGEDIKKRLQEVSLKYDPEGLFQRAVPGGFKVFD